MSTILMDKLAGTHCSMSDVCNADNIHLRCSRNCNDFREHIDLREVALLSRDKHLLIA